MTDQRSVWIFKSQQLKKSKNYQSSARMREKQDYDTTQKECVGMLKCSLFNYISGINAV